MKIHPHPHVRSLANRTISRCLHLGRVASFCGLIGGVIVALASVARAETTSLMTLELKEVGSVSGQLLGSAAAPRLWGNVDSPRLYAVSGEEEEERGDQFKPYLEELFLGFVIYPQEQGEVQLTWGYFDHVETNHDSQFLFEVEYGITDTLQIGLALPVDFLPEESYDGIRNIGVELYWNFYNNPHTGRGYGVGFEVGLPSDAPAGESRSYIYEPFVVAYQDFQTFAVNFSGAVEIENALQPGEPTETSGEMAAAVFGPVGKFTPMLELGLEIEADRTPVRLAPGLYWSPCDKPVDFAVAFPIGLNSDAPDFGVFLLAIVEFETT